MERFAVLGMAQKHRDRYVQSHPILKNLPLNFGERFILKMAGPRITGTIKHNNNELGYIVDVPSFFVDWDILSDEKRLKGIRRLLKILKEREIGIIIAPLLQQIFTKQEYEYCLDEGFILLDSFNIRLVSQIEAVEKILAILQKKLHKMNAFIWRADTELGEVWAEFLAPYFNYMALGGKDRARIKKLSERIIDSTGLACTNIDKMEDIIDESAAGNFVLVWTERFDPILKDMPKGLIIISDPMDGGFFNRSWVGDGQIFMESHILVESGWIEFPDDIYCSVDLSPLEELSVLEGIFYIMSEVYRSTVSSGRIDLKRVMKLRKLFELYPLYFRGFVSSNQFVSYNGFRRIYFRKIWK